MQLTKMGSLAALVGVGYAFLVPPTVENVHIEVIPIDIAAAIGAAKMGRIIEAPCPGCPVAGAVGTLYAAESVLRFNISIQHADQQPDALMINTLQAFPRSITGFTGLSLFADQFIRKPDGNLVYASTPELGYAMRIKALQDDLSEFEVHLRIMQVAGTLVRGVPSINMKVMKAPNGNLILIPDEVANPFTSPPVAVGEKCSTLLCHWKAMIANKVNALKKGCGSKNGGPHRIPRPYGIKGGHPKPEGYGRPHAHRRPRHGAIARIIRGLIFHVIVPILIGIALGVTASIVGMLVGHFIVFLWRLLFRRGEGARYCRVKQEDSVKETNEEAQGFLDNQGPPPVYEEVVVVEEKNEQK